MDSKTYINSNLTCWRSKSNQTENSSRHFQGSVRFSTMVIWVWRESAKNSPWQGHKTHIFLSFVQAPTIRFPRKLLTFPLWIRRYSSFNNTMASVAGTGTHATILEANQEGIRQAAQNLKEGKIVAFPTETVYGLGANALMEDSVLQIFRVKGRPLTDPLIVHVPTIKVCRHDCVCFILFLLKQYF
jgi:hypothetical protein